MARGNRRKGQRRVALPMGTLGERTRATLDALRKGLRRGGNRRTVAGRRATASREATTSARRASVADVRRAGVRGALKGVGAFVAWTLPLVVAIAAFATPMLGVQAYEYVMSSGHFHVREVLVEGNRRLDYDQISALLGVVPGTHLLQTDLDALSERLEAHPWVSWAKVSRELPDRLVVELVEHQPAAYLSAGALYLVNHRGAIFAEAAADERLDLPVITGIPLESFDDPARRGEAESRMRGAINVARLYSAMGLSGRWPIGELRVDMVRGLTLVLSPAGTEAVLGHAPYREKLFRLEWVLESLRQDGKTAEYVILDAHGVGPGATLDDGRVVVKAEHMAAGSQELMQRAAERAREAERRVLGLPADPDLFGPALTPAMRSAGDGAAELDADEAARRPTLSGGRPAQAPIDELDGEEE